jgi:hypothetical protein
MHLAAGRRPQRRRPTERPTKVKKIETGEILDQHAPT